MLADDAPAMDAPAMLATSMSTAAPAFRPALTLGPQPGATVLLLEITSRAEGSPTPEPPPVPPTPPIVTSGLVLHLDAGNAASYPGSGTAWTDLSGNGNNGTLINGPTYSAADGGQIIFDGVNDYVNTNYTQPITAQYTLEIWYKSTDSNNGGIGKTLINNRGSGAGISISFGINPIEDPVGSTAKIGAFWMGGDSDSYISQIASSSNNFNDNSWRQMIGVFSQASGTNVTPSSFSIFQNGVFISATTTSGILQFGAKTSPLGPGLGGTQFMRAEAWGTFLQGSLAIARIYNRALSASEVSQNFDANRARFGL